VYLVSVGSIPFDNPFGWLCIATDTIRSLFQQTQVVSEMRSHFHSVQMFSDQTCHTNINSIITVITNECEIQQHDANQQKRSASIYCLCDNTAPTVWCYYLSMNSTCHVCDIWGFHGDEVQVVVFWFVTLRSDVVGHQRFGKSHFLHLLGEVKVVALAALRPTDWLSWAVISFSL
jgi:hypothetical protein